jgi:hypothetical protein
MAIVNEAKGKNPFVGLLTKMAVIAGTSVILYFIAETVVIDLIKLLISTTLLLLGY